MESTNPLKDQFLAIGLDAKVVDSTLKNKKVSQRLEEVIKESKVKEANKHIGNLFYVIATKVPESLYNKTGLLCEYVLNEKISRPQQLDEAIKYLQKQIQSKGVDNEVDRAEFEKASGVGVNVTDEDIEKMLDQLFEENKAQILEKGYSFQFNNILYKSKDIQPWADQKKVLDSINKRKVDLLGEAPKDDGARKKKNKETKEDKDEKKKKAADKEAHPEQVDDAAPTKDITELVGRDMNSAMNSAELLKKHHEATGGKVVTRFPPEPNGYLHIGHAKAMRFNFTIAQAHDGITYLRYDDTNPVKENQEFIQNIKNCVYWLGYKPYKITYSSEYFDQLYEFAKELIKKGKAFICHQTKDEIKQSRVDLTESQYRNRSVEENLKLFEHMKQGRFEENECSLRLKIDMKHHNPCMRDPVAYRIRYVTHPHIGDKWCIYPTYDYTHCIVDSLENITHSLCTLEFEIRRELYYWILEALDIYRPFVWEYSRLNITYNVLSKRKLEKLVLEGFVSGWDDPRLFTLMGLKRRGYTPSIINEFCNEIGVARKGNENTTSVKLLEFFARKELDREATRSFGVLDPVLLEIQNLEDVKEKEIDAPLFPTDKTKGSQKYNVSKYIYIDREDFSDVQKAGFYGLTPEQPVCLKYGPVIQLVDIVKKGGEVDHIKVKVLPDFAEKLKGYIHWVSKEHSIDAEVRLYNYLFKVPEVRDDWLQQLSSDSLIVKSNAKVWRKHAEDKEGDRYQFERVGYFVVDKDSKTDKVDGKVVFNRIVELKESKEKKVNLGKQ